MRYTSKTAIIKKGDILNHKLTFGDVLLGYIFYFFYFIFVVFDV